MRKIQYVALNKTSKANGLQNGGDKSRVGRMAFVWAAIDLIHITKNWTLRQNVKNAIMERDT